ERRGLSMDQAFTTLRGWARTNNRKLADVALALIDNDHTVTELAHQTPKRQQPSTPGAPVQPPP
ncbi:ANTAR domain-containing protein, partial [Actinomadura scrupuli]|uniref:ANTAR domain-containing protein n=1 Tax=Actinomadura scrupuli TaxID=559629 RepID=UPI003D97A3EC